MTRRRRLIVNADDLGYDPAVTRGILVAAREGLVSSATLMVNTPYSASAAEAARGLAIGLHLNLARWEPVSEAFSPLLLREGSFDEAQAAQLPAQAVEVETLAQLRRLEALLGAPPTHLDVHKHLHRHSGVLEGVTRAAAQRGLPVRALDARMRTLLVTRAVPVTDHFIGDAGTEAYWTLERWKSALRALPEGITELMCHPGYTPTEVQSGYGAQREVELITLTSQDARAALEDAGVELVDFRALR